MILLLLSTSLLLLEHTTSNRKAWHLFVDSRAVKQLAHFCHTLRQHHWFPVKGRSQIAYKIACLFYHCHNSSALSYVTDMLLKRPLRFDIAHSSSDTMPFMNRHTHSKATLGDRSFSFASVWNYIPIVRCVPSLSSF